MLNFPQSSFSADVPLVKRPLAQLSVSYNVAPKQLFEFCKDFMAVSFQPAGTVSGQPYLAAARDEWLQLAWISFAVDVQLLSFCKDKLAFLLHYKPQNDGSYRHSCQVIQPGQPFKAQISGQSSGMVVCLDYNFLCRHISNSALRRRIKDPEYLQHVCLILQDYIAQHSSVISYAGATNLLQMLKYALLRVLETDVLSPLPPTSAGIPQRLSQAINIIQRPQGLEQSVDDIAKQIGVSTRTLYDDFRKHLKCSPYKYQAYMRLFNVREKLLTSGDKSRINIADIAMQEGFFHLGRFASSYRQVFGELPRSTRQWVRAFHQRYGNKAAVEGFYGWQPNELKKLIARDISCLPEKTYDLS